MKLFELSTLGAAALAAFTATPSAAVNPALRSSAVMDIEKHDFSSFLESEVAQRLFEKMKEDTESLSGSTSAQIMKALKPTFKDLLAEFLKSAAPGAKEECKKVVEEVMKAGGEGEEDDDDFEFDGFVEQRATVKQSTAATEQSSVMFLDNVKKYLGAAAGLAGPFLQALVHKLDPVIHRLGEKAAPFFGEAIQKLIRKACEQAEQLHGLEA